MNKPEFLYHGSRYFVDMLIPHKAHGLPEENGDLFGIYAYESIEAVIPFALTISPFDDGVMEIYVDDITGHVTIGAGIWDDAATGYIYKLSAQAFEKIDGKQWLARQPVLPIEYTVINSRDYGDLVHFTGRAKTYRENSKRI